MIAKYGSSMDDDNSRVIGKVVGSDFSRRWYAFTERPDGSCRLGQYLDEASARKAVVAAINLGPQQSVSRNDRQRNR